MIQLNNIEKGYGGQTLFDDVNFSINEKERVGLLGRNGTGKSTLLKIIAGLETEDAGTFLVPTGYKIGFLKQHLEFSEQTILDECAKSLGSDEQFDTYKAEKILFGLGFKKEDLEKAPSDFSGGFQIRLNLAKLLLEAPNLLLLDEPTNYLDIVSIKWLASFLKGFEGEIILITHDRDFMNMVCTHCMGLTRGKLKKIKGSTDQYYDLLAQDDELYLKTKENLDRKRKELEKFVERFKAKASKAKAAQSKQKALDKMEELEDLAFEQIMNLKFKYLPIKSKIIGEVKNLSFKYPNMYLNLFEDLNFTLEREECVAIVGANGKGKSTLLNVLAGELKQLTGEAKLHSLAKIGLFGQTNIERLSPTVTIIDEISSANESLSITDVRGICGAMLFSNDLAEKKISVLSGGEKARVMLGKILARESNLLFLDEPTNHLDMESIEVLISEIKSFKGCSVLVTHSEYLLRELATKLIVFQNGKALVFDGGYDDFLNKIGFEELETEQKIKKKSINKKELVKLRQDLIKEKSKLTKPLEKSILDAEEIISKSENEMDEINNTIITKQSELSGEEIGQLTIQISVLEKAIEDNFDILESKTNELDAINLDYKTKLDDLEK